MLPNIKSSDEPIKKTSDVALLYCEDPVNDPDGGWKSRYRTLEKAYRPDLPQVANAWHCVSDPDGNGTYKIQQKDLHKCNVNCWMLVGENVGDDQWTSAKMTVGDFLSLNSFTLPEIGDITYIDMNPVQIPMGPPRSHITDPKGTAWAYPGETLKFMCNWSNSAFFKASDLTFQWTVNNGPVRFKEGAQRQDPHIIFDGGAGEVAQIGLRLTYKDDAGVWSSSRLTIMGQAPSKSPT